MGVSVPAGAVVVVNARRCDGAGAVVDSAATAQGGAVVATSTLGGGVDWQFRCCDGGCGRTYQQPGPLCTHVNHGIDSDDPAVAAMHLAYAGVQVAASAAHDAALAATARWPAVVWKLAERRVRLWEAGGAVRAGFSALDTADLGMVSNAVAALPVLEDLPPTRSTPPEEPPDLQQAPPSWGVNVDEVRRWEEDQRRVLRRAPRLSAGHVDMWRWEHIKDLDVPSWRMWVNRCMAGRSHSRTAAFSANGTVFALLHKDDHAAREKRAKTGGPLRVRPPGVGSVLVRLASAHALVRVGAPISHYPGWMTGALGRRWEAHAALLERIASFGTSGYGCHHGAMRLLVECSVRQTGFLSRMM
eukprot:jgi/Tetstr1/437205/TSEL_025936.t1